MIVSINLIDIYFYSIIILFNLILILSIKNFINYYNNKSIISEQANKILMLLDQTNQWEVTSKYYFQDITIESKKYNLIIHPYNRKIFIKSKNSNIIEDKKCNFFSRKEINVITSKAKKLYSILKLQNQTKENQYCRSYIDNIII